MGTRKCIGQPPTERTRLWLTKTTSYGVRPEYPLVWVPDSRTRSERDFDEYKQRVTAFQPNTVVRCRRAKKRTSFLYRTRSGNPNVYRLCGAFVPNTYRTTVRGPNGTFVLYYKGIQRSPQIRLSDARAHTIYFVYSGGCPAFTGTYPTCKSRSQILAPKEAFCE
jgi:hypothetical protein